MEKYGNGLRFCILTWNMVGSTLIISSFYKGHGDGRLVAVVVPDPDTAASWAKQRESQGKAGLQVDNDTKALTEHRDSTRHLCTPLLALESKDGWLVAHGNAKRSPV